MHDIKQQLETLVGLSSAGVYLTDAKGNCTYVDQRWCDMAGMKAEEALGSGWVQGIHPDHRQSIAERWYQAAETNGEWDLEYNMVTPEGKTTPVLGQAKALYDSRRRVSGYLGINFDISERKKLEATLQEYERRYAELLAAVNAYTYTVMLEDGVPVSTEHSPACKAITGYAPEEYAEDTSLWMNMIHPEDQNAVRDHLSEVLDRKISSPIEHRIFHKNGSIRWVRDTIVCHLDPEGNLVQYDGLVEDITECKRAERRLRQILESAPDAMILVDRNGRIVSANDQTERHFQFRRDELLQQPVELLLPEHFSEGHVTLRTQYTALPGVRRMSKRPTLTARRKDGSHFPVDIALSPIETEEGVLIAAAVRDVSDRMRMEEAIQSNLEILAALNSILTLGLQQLSLKEHLDHTLEILFSLPWLELESKGAVFLVENGSDTLILECHQGFSDSQVHECHKVPFGRCHCGRTAESRQVVFVSCVDERHEKHYDDMQPHGHYCVPILSDEELLGVVNLYVCHGHKETSRQSEFLSSVATVLGGIIKRKQAETALQESEERFQLAIRGTDAGVWDWNLLTNQVYFSPRWKQMLGYQEDELKNDYTEWERLLHPEDREYALATIRDYLEGRTTEYELEHRLQHKDGTYRWILARGAAVRDVYGKPHRMVGSHLDITDRKKAEQKRIDREIQLTAAQRIQEHILPTSAPEVPGFDIAGGLIPAEYAAGDYFDFLWLPDGSLGLIVGDVCGHGVSSALLMATTAAHIRSFAEDHSDVQEIMEHTNSILCREIEDCWFVTMVFARLDPASRTLQSVNAGHPSGYVLSQSGEVKATLESGSLPLGILSDSEFPVTGSVQLETNDTVLLVTDGVLEAHTSSDKFFGADQMLEIVRTNLHRQADEIVEHLQAEVANFTESHERQDDVTVVVMKVSAD